VNAKQRKTLIAIFTRPTPASIPFVDIESLVKAGMEAKRYQVEEARELECTGVRP
jgi:hypothetical protein